MKLYELKGEWAKILDKLRHAETEEEQQSIKEDLAAIKDATEIKLDNCGRVYRSLLAEAEAYENEAERLKRKAQTLNNQAEGLKGYIGLVLQPGNRVKTQFFDFSWRKSQAVEVEHIEAIPEAYRRSKTIVEADKNLLKQDLQIGAEIPGARLVERLSLQIK